MERTDVQTWLDRYVEAWRANEAGPIEALFSADAVYRYHPYDTGDDVLRGRDAIVASWLEEPDDPDSWEAAYEPFAVDGDRAVAIGTSRYRATTQETERTYHNVFLLRFADDGSCAEFTECFLLEPARSEPQPGVAGTDLEPTEL